MNIIEKSKMNNEILREASGEVNIDSKLVAFFYLLMRDHLPNGEVEKLVRECEESNNQYTNGWLAKYAENLANRLQSKEQVIANNKPARLKKKTKKKVFPKILNDDDDFPIFNEKDYEDKKSHSPMCGPRINDYDAYEKSPYSSKNKSK